MQELTPELRRELKARAHPLKPVVMIGNDGLTPPVLAEIERALKSHELIKIRVRGDDRQARSAWLDEICTHTGAQAIQLIGKILVVHRSNPKEEAKPAARKVRRGTPLRSAPLRSTASRPARVGPAAFSGARREQEWRTPGRPSTRNPGRGTVRKTARAAPASPDSPVRQRGTAGRATAHRGTGPRRTTGKLSGNLRGKAGPKVRR